MNRKAVWWMFGVVLLTGCIPSLNAIYTDKDVVFRKDVVGVWTPKNSSESWDFRRREDNSYRLIYTDREGHTGSFIAHLAEIEDTLFLDLLPEESENARPGFHRFHQVPIHSIYLVKEAGDKVVLASIDHTWLSKYIQDHPSELASATFGSRWMITAPTEQLQRFLVDNKDRFKHDFELQRQDSARDE